MPKRLFTYVCSIRDRVLEYLRVKEVEAYTGRKAKGLRIIGKVYITNPNIYFGENNVLYPGVMIQGYGEVHIGDNTFIENNTMIYSEKDYRIDIGNNCMIAGQCYIINTDHMTDADIPMIEQGTTSESIIIEDDCWLGGSVTILKGSLIKKGTVLGAKSLIKGKTEENGIYSGIPAKLIKYRTNNCNAQMSN